MRILIIANPIVGIRQDRRAVVQAVVSHIEKSGGSVDVTYSMKSGYGRRYAGRAALEGYDTVYVAGGDGTVNDVVSGLAGGPLPLGILPLGTGNGLARSLGIPFDTPSLIDMLTARKVSAIDVGRISSRYFVATAGIGYDASIASDFNRQRTVKRSILGYFRYGIKHFFLGPQEDLTLVVDGNEMRRKVFGLTIANTSQYGGGAMIAPQADPRSGNLVAVLFPKLNPFKAVSVVKKLFRGEADKVREFEFITFKNLKIKRAAAGIFQVDGETYKGDANLNVSVMPGALNVIVP